MPDHLQIALSISYHPVTGVPMLRVWVKDSEGNQADDSIRLSEIFDAMNR